MGCQLYVVIEAGDAAPERLAAAFGAADLASVLIVPPAGRPLDAAAARPLIEAAQRRGAAALVATDARLARSLGADGFPHASHPEIEVDTLGIDEPESRCKM